MKGIFTMRTLFLRYLIIIFISVQHAQKRSCNRNSVRPAMLGKRDSLARMRNSSRWQRSGFLGPLGDNPTCVQSLKVYSLSLQIYMSQRKIRCLHLGSRNSLTLRYSRNTVFDGTIEKSFTISYDCRNLENS